VAFEEGDVEMRVVGAAPSILLLSLGLAACAPYEGDEDVYDEYPEYGYGPYDFGAYGPYDFGTFGFFDGFDDFEVERRHHHHRHADGHDHVAGDHHHGAGSTPHQITPPPSHGMTGQLQHRFTPPPRPPSVFLPRSPTISR
jgi:hypothetical protein